MNSVPAPLLLDTHYWIWLQTGEKGRVSTISLKAIEEAVSDGRLLVSVMSIWELGMLESKGRLELSMPVEEWVRVALATPGLTLAPLTPEIALESTRLPGAFHADPSDRIIVATARKMSARLLTSDEKILRYGRQHHVAVL